MKYKNYVKQLGKIDLEEDEIKTSLIERPKDFRIFDKVNNIIKADVTNPTTKTFEILTTKTYLSSEINTGTYAIEKFMNKQTVDIKQVFYNIRTGGVFLYYYNQDNELWFTTINSNVYSLLENNENHKNYIYNHIDNKDKILVSIDSRLGLISGQTAKTLYAVYNTYKNNFNFTGTSGLNPAVVVQEVLIGYAYAHEKLLIKDMVDLVIQSPIRGLFKYLDYPNFGNYQELQLEKAFEKVKTFVYRRNVQEQPPIPTIITPVSKSEKDLLLTTFLNSYTNYTNCKVKDIHKIKGYNNMNLGFFVKNLYAQSKQLILEIYQTSLTNNIMTVDEIVGGIENRYNIKISSVEIV